MNILLVDDHELIRNGIARIISEEFPFSTLVEVGNGNSAERLARADKFDIIIMDISMPDKNGLDVLKQLRSESNKTPILILSIHPENQYALRSLRAGGNGYLTKNCGRTDLVNAINTVVKGRKFISPEVAEKLVSVFDNTVEKEQHELVSDRELQVLKLIASGKTVSEIANELTLSVATISTYRARLKEKMNMKNNAELTTYAINNHLV